MSRSLALCSLSAALAAAGCSGLKAPSLAKMSLPWQKVPLDASAGFYDRASLVYRLDAGQLAQTLDVARG